MGNENFERIELSIDRIRTFFLPHHQQICSKHKIAVFNLLKENNESNSEDFKTLESEIDANISQLESFLFELAELSRKVRVEDASKFDSLVTPIRKTILNCIREYSNMKAHLKYPTNYRNGLKAIEVATEEDQLQLYQTQSELEHDLRIAKDVKMIENDVIDIHDLFCQFGENIHNQGANVDAIESNLAQAEEKINDGFQDIIRAAKYKRTMYPMTGAVIGTVFGGPVGLIAGLKIGLGAAFCCGFLGYTGGKIIHECDKANISQFEQTKNKTA